MIVSTPRESLWAWLNSRIGVPWSEDFRAVGLVRGGCLVAVAGYNGFTGRTCFMHLAIDETEKTSRTFVRAIFEYPFLQAGLTQVFALVMEDNVRALKVDQKTGFTEVNRFEDAGMTGQTLVLLRMTRNECRWINGKRKLASAPGLRWSGRSPGPVVTERRESANMGESPQCYDSVGFPNVGRIVRH